MGLEWSLRFEPVQGILPMMQHSAWEPMTQYYMGAKEYLKTKKNLAFRCKLKNGSKYTLYIFVILDP